MGKASRAEVSCYCVDDVVVVFYAGHFHKPFSTGRIFLRLPSIFPFYGLFKRHVEKAIVGARQEVIPAPGDRWNDPLGLCQACS